MDILNDTAHTYIHIPEFWRAKHLMADIPGALSAFQLLAIRGVD